MAETTSASIHSLHQPKRPLTDAERAKAYRDRKKAKGLVPQKPPQAEPGKLTRLTVARPVTSPVTKPVTSRVTPSRPLAQWLLIAAALGLGLVGMAVNGTFAKSLGSTESAGWLFLAIGVAADLIALAMPAAAAAAWATRRRLSALTGWLIWSIAFAFVVSAGIGFASLNVTDVTLARASRVTPAVETAKAALADAMTSRDRECAGGVGKNCRAREDAVSERRRALDGAMQTVTQAADPQIASAARMVTWVSAGSLTPSGDDVAMLRLILLALLPQLGGLLLIVGRSSGASA